MIQQGYNSLDSQSTQPAGEIATQMQALRDVLGANGRSLEELYQRLSPVLSPQRLGGASAKSGPSEVKQSEAPLAEAIASIVHEAETHAVGINEIIKRLAI